MDNLERLTRVYKKANIEREIERLKQRLASSDYKIIKMYEYSLQPEPHPILCPYDCEVLHEERQVLRDKINERQAELDNLI